MSEDDKTDEKGAAEGTLKDRPNPKPEPGSPRKFISARGEPMLTPLKAKGQTLTSVAYTSAELSDPDKAGQVRELWNAGEITDGVAAWAWTILATVGD
jgi:hypothetical protein